MRTSVLLAAAALGLGAVTSANAQGFSLNPYATPSNSFSLNPYATTTKGIGWSPFGGVSNPTPPSGASQATFPTPGQALSGPSRLINLLPSLNPISNTHYIGYSVFPTQTDQYLAQFGYQKLR